MNKAEELRQRTKRFAIRIVNLFRSLPKTDEARVIGRQVLRSGTSVAANYRAVCRARSKEEFISKTGILVETGIVKKEKLANLLQEAEELLSIFAASQKTAKSRIGD